MISVISFALGHIKRRKKQNILILIVMLSAATMLFSALSLLFNINGVVEEVLEEHKVSHLSLRFNRQHHDPDQLATIWRETGQIDSLYIQESLIRNGQIAHEGQNIPAPEVVISKPRSEPVLHDYLRLIDGENTLKPEQGQVWITTAFANSENLSIGDSIEIKISGQPALSFIVSAVMFDPQYSNDFMPPRFWVSDETFSIMAADQASVDIIMGIRLTDASYLPEAWETFLSEFDGQYMGHVLDYDNIVMGYAILYNIIGGSVLGFSAILLFVAIFIVITVLQRNIVSEMATIGILKTQGFSSGQIKLAFMAQFTFLTTCALLLSLATGSLILRYAGNLIFRNLGRDGTGLMWLIPYLITFILLTATTVLATFSATVKIRKIRPLEAFRHTAHIRIRKNNGSLKAALINHLPMPLFLGIKQIMQKKGQSVFLTLIAVFTAFTVFYGVSGIASLKQSFENMAFWGADNRDLTMTTTYTRPEETVQLSAVIRDLDMVASFSDYREVPAAISGNMEQETTNLTALIYSDFDAIDVMNIRGRSPQVQNEVSISTVVAETYDKTIGDTLRVSIGDEKNTFIITGVYQTVLHTGGNIRLHSSVMNLVDLSANYSYLIMLEDQVSPAAFAEYFSNNHPQMNIAIDDMSEIQGIFNTMSVLMEPVMLAISIVFIFIMLIILTNFVLMNVVEFRKEYGLYKSIGMSKTQIRSIMITSYAILTLIGSVVSVGIGILIVPEILLLTMRVFGFETFPFVLPVTETLLIAPCITLFVIACTWLAGKGVDRISPRTLITE